MKKRIYSVLVENRSGVLCKVAGLFSRRCFNIDSVAVGTAPMIQQQTIHHLQIQEAMYQKPVQRRTQYQEVTQPIRQAILHTL